MKFNKKFFAAAGCASVLAFSVTGCSAPAQAETPAQTEATMTETSAEETTADVATEEAADLQKETLAEDDMLQADTLCVWGPILGIEGSSITMDNQSDVSVSGELILNLGEDTLILDAVDGLPKELSELQTGELIYVNLGEAMSMSLPPQNNPEVIICSVPEDLKAPAYVQVIAMEQESDESYTLKASNGETYKIPADCQILPYLTRNIVKLQDVNEGSTVLVWSDEENQAQKLVLFAEIVE